MSSYHSRNKSRAWSGPVHWCEDGDDTEDDDDSEDDDEDDDLGDVNFQLISMNYNLDFCQFSISFFLVNVQNSSFSGGGGGW